MNQNENDVALPEGAQLGGVDVLKVLNRVISENQDENGYMVVLGNGETKFVTDDEFAELAPAVGGTE